MKIRVCWSKDLCVGFRLKGWNRVLKKAERIPNQSKRKKKIKVAVPTQEIKQSISTFPAGQCRTDFRKASVAESEIGNILAKLCKNVSINAWKVVIVESVATEK